MNLSCIKCRSEIHEKMNCTRCQNYEYECESKGEHVEDETEHGSPQSEKEETDVGGFAGLAGCLHKLKNSEKQVGGIRITYPSVQLLSHMFYLVHCTIAIVYRWEILLKKICLAGGITFILIQYLMPSFNLQLATRLANCFSKFDCTFQKNTAELWC